MRTAFSGERTEADYYEAIEGKPASLMSSSCRVGALTAGLDDDQVEALSEFGRCFGMIYQLRDDILDATATEHQLGKPAGQDVAEAIATYATQNKITMILLGETHRPRLSLVFRKSIFELILDKTANIDLVTVATHGR